MTGATGDLTPDDADQAFIPAELREISDPEHQADLTTTQSRHGEGGEAAGDAGGAAPRDDGYGAAGGLSTNDPAYRMESRGHVTDEEAHRAHHDTDGDEFADHEEHF